MLKKGDKVIMVNCGEARYYADRVWTVTTNEQKLHESHNYTVVWLKDFSGCFASDCLKKI